MEEDIKHHKHANFFRRMRKLTRSRVIPLKISVWLGIDMHGKIIGATLAGLKLDSWICH